MPSTLRSACGKVHCAGEIIRKAGSALDLKQIVDDGPAQIEIAQQHGAFRQVRLRQRQVDRS